MVGIAPGCQAIDEDLSAWIDGELGAGRSAEIEAHLATCSACEARASELRAVDRALRAIPAPAVASDLQERLGRRLRAARASAPSPGRRAPVRRRLAAVLALPTAAAAALALYLALRPAGPRGDAGGGPAIARGSEADLEALAPEELALVLELETIEDLPVIANLDLLERMLAAEAG